LIDAAAPFCGADGRRNPASAAKGRSRRRKALRVLLTNAYLSDRGGSELYIRDIAVELRRRGHQPVAYSTILGEVAEEMRAEATPVIDDLKLLTEPPDVIHGHHIFDAAAACLRFPRTPAVYACHGWRPWLETPLVLASVRRYVAVSQLTRDRLLTAGVPSERVTIIPNFVDFERFPRRRDPRVRVRRALVYGNGWSADSPAFLAIREACLSRGFELEGAGYAFGRPTAQPGELLPGFDVVFALGRSALEAMACGSAVILAGPDGFGGAISRQSFAAQRAANFGLAVLVGQSVTAERVGEALDSYDAADVAALGDLVRAEAGVGTAVDRWEEQYRLAIAEGPPPLAELTAGVSESLVKLKAATFHFERGYASLAAKRDALASRLAGVEAQNAALSARAAELEAKLACLETPVGKRLLGAIRDAMRLKRPRN